MLQGKSRFFIFFGEASPVFQKPFKEMGFPSKLSVVVSFSAGRKPLARIGWFNFFNISFKFQKGPNIKTEKDLFFVPLCILLLRKKTYLNITDIGIR